MKLASVLILLLVLPGTVASQAPASSDPAADYPEGYRGWTHVKSALVSPAHRNFANTGGFQHIYANPQAMNGYRTRTFPEGSIIAFDWLEMTDVNGAFQEGA